MQKLFRIWLTFIFIFAIIAAIIIDKSSIVFGFMLIPLIIITGIIIFMGFLK